MDLILCMICLAAAFCRAESGLCVIRLPYCSFSPTTPDFPYVPLPETSRCSYTLTVSRHAERIPVSVQNRLHAASARNPSVWLSAQPVKFSGFIERQQLWSFVVWKAGSAAIRSSRSFSAPSSLTRFAGCHGVLADLFVEHLSVAAFLYSVHHDVFCCHERQLAHEAGMDHLRINHQSGSDVHVESPGCHLRPGSSPDMLSLLVGRVIQRPFKPLRRCRDRRVQHAGDHEVGKGRDTLRTHRVALVCHCGRTDLVLFKRLFDFLEVLQQTDVVAEFVSALCDAAERMFSTLGIYLSGISLSGYRIASFESHFLGDLAVELL